jgi:hypothetical protein
VSTRAARVGEGSLFFPLMSFWFCFFRREPGGESSQLVATIIMLICAGWYRKTIQSIGELPLSTCVDHVPEHAPE